MRVIALAVLIAGVLPHAQDYMTSLPKRAALGRLVSTQPPIPLADALPLIDAGLVDPDPTVRAAAVLAVAGRAQMSAPSDEARILRDRYYERAVTMARADAAPHARHSALIALENLEFLLSSEELLSDRLLALMFDIYEADADVMMRVEVLKGFRLISNVTPRMLAAMRAALIDPDLRIQHEAQRAITLSTTGGKRKLSFEFVAETIIPALDARSANVRLGAVRTLNIYGAPSAKWIPKLRDMARTDADQQVRASAQLAIESIERALAGRETP